MGFQEQHWASEAIIIRRSDVSKVYNHAYHKYEQTPNKVNLRNFLIIRVTRKIGLRNSEIRLLEIERIDFESRIVEVLDSKKHEFIPLTLDMLTLQLIQDLVGTRSKGYVFVHQGSWIHVKADQPLSRVEIWQIVHDIADEVGVKGFNPRKFREAFAYEWYKKMMKDKHSKKTMKGLQKYMRHSDSKTTDIYLDKLYSPEDLQEEFDDDGTFQSEFEGIQNQPLVVPAEVASAGSICDNCSNLSICKFALLPSCVSECRFKVAKSQVSPSIIKGEIC
jgi:integrase